MSMEAMAQIQGMGPSEGVYPVAAINSVRASLRR